MNTVNVPNSYLELPYDLAGSRSKNRFRVELLWGISKMLDLMGGKQDFVAIFDYVCDVEFVFENGFEFYQIKSKSDVESHFTCTSLSRKESPNSNNSILGKLYLLRSASSQTVKLAIVSNVALKVGKKIIADDEYELLSLSEPDQQKIIDVLKDELKVQTVDLSQVYYIHVHINLKDPEYEVKGKLITCFNKIMGVEPRNPNALYNLVRASVRDRACFEFRKEEQKQVADIVKNKGITRREFEELLKEHAQDERTGIGLLKDFIAHTKGILRQRSYNIALTKILKLRMTSKELMRLEQELVAALFDCDGSDEIPKLVEELRERYDREFSTEYSEEEKIIFIALVVCRFAEGGYGDATTV